MSTDKVDEDSEDSSNEAEDSDDTSDQPLSPTTDQQLSFPADQREFHIALIFAEDDEKLADNIKKDMSKIVLNCGRKVKVVDYNNPTFGGSRPQMPCQFTSSCVLSLVVLTENTLKEKKCKFMIEEAIAETRIEGDDEEQTYCVRSLHTLPPDQRHYDIPKGLKAVDAVDWFGPIDGCQDKLKTLLDNSTQKKSECGKRYQSNLHLPDSSTGSRKGQLSQSRVSPELERMISRGNLLRKSKQQKLFYQTFSVTQAKNTLMKKRFVFLVGKSGDGKTATAYHILEDLISRDESLYPFIIQKPEDLDLISDSSSDRRYVVLVDDIFGISSFSLVTLFQKWKSCYFPLLETLVNDGVVYFIATSLNHILSRLHVSDIPLLSNVIDTTTDDYSLRTYEKKPMLTEYLEKYKVHMSEEMKDKAVNARLPIGFPQCCNYYVTNDDAKAVGPKFFQKPLVYLQDKISDLKKNNNLAYLVLVMAIFEKGRLRFDTLDPFQSSPPPYMKDLKQACGVTKHTTWEEIKQETEEVCKIGYLVCNESENIYVFPHQSVYDAVCFIFGKQSMQKVIEICPLDFLLDHTTLEQPDKKTTQNVFQIKGNVKQSFIDRLIAEIKAGSYKVLEHSAFSKDDFLGDVKKNDHFLEALKEMFASRETVKHLIKSRMLYYLTAAKTESPLSLMIVQMIGNMDIHGKDKLLHDILEGACSSGDIVLFNEVMSRDPKPCEKCFLLAAESQTDQPAIMIALPKETFTQNQRRILKVLIKKGRVETIKRVSESINWRCFHTEKRRQKLFTTVCLNGDSKMFSYLKEFVKLPHCTEELLVSGIIGKNKSIVKKLLTEDNMNSKDRLGRTPLHHACYHTPNLCKLLVDAGVEMNILDKRGATPFHMACQTMTKREMKKLLDLGFEVTISGHTTSDTVKLSPLHMAAQNKNGSALVDTLIARGPGPSGPSMLDFPDGTNSTPLHIASEKPHGDSMIRILLKKGANHMLKDKHGKTALHIAAQANLPHNIKDLLDKYEDVNVRDKKERTPLHLAVSRRDLSRDERYSLADSVNHLLQKKADVNLADINGNTVINTAALHNAPYMIFEILLTRRQKEVKCNNRKESPLHLLLSPDLKVDTMNLLLKKYPKNILEIKTIEGKSVLQVALEKQAPYNIVSILLKKTSCAKRIDWTEINFSLSFKLYTADQIVHFLKQCSLHFPPDVKQNILRLLCSREMSDEKWEQGMELLTRGSESLLDQSLVHGVASSPKKFRYLLEKGASVNASDINGTPLLHSLINQGNFDGVELLLGKDGTQVASVDKDNDTALLKIVKLSVASHFMEIQEYYDQSVTPSLLYGQLGKSVLSYFGEFKRPLANTASKTIPLLLKLPVPLNDKDTSGNAAVHYAVQDLQILKQLKSAGADLHQKGSKGQSCLHIACTRNTNTEVVEYLLENSLLPTDCDEYGLTPLHIALASKMTDLPVLRKLYKPHTKASLQLPFIHVASYFGTTEVVKMFIDIDHKNLFTEDKEGHLPIHCAVAGGDLEVVKLITEAMKAATENKASDENRELPAGKLDLSTKTQGNPLLVENKTGGSGDQSGGRDDLSKESSDQSLVNSDQYVKTQSVGCGDQSTDKAWQSTGSGDVCTESQVEYTERPDGSGAVLLGKENANEGLQMTSSESDKLATVQSSFEGRSLSSDDHLHHQKLQQVMVPWGKKSRKNLLCFASKYSSTDVVLFLLNEGFDTQQCDDDGNSPLHIAATYVGGIEEVPDDDESDCTEFHLSLEKSRHEIFELLLKSNAPFKQMEIFNNDGLTPLHVACTGYFPYKKISSLIEHGASVSTCSSKDRKNALHFISSNGILALLYCLKNSLKGKWNLDYPDIDTMRILKILIEKGCPVDSKDAQGQTALHLAAAVGNAVFVNILLENKANIEAVDNDGRTPLHRALKKKEVSCDLSALSLRLYSAALCLVEKGAQLHAKDHSGVSPHDMLTQLLKEGSVSKEIQLICEHFSIPMERVGHYGICDRSQSVESGLSTP